MYKVPSSTWKNSTIFPGPRGKPKEKLIQHLVGEKQTFRVQKDIKNAIKGTTCVCVQKKKK